MRKTTDDLRDFSIHIQSFMVNDLDLSGTTELLIYAVIYDSTIGEKGYTGGIKFLERITGIKKRGVIKSLNKLLSKNLLTKKVFYQNNVRLTEYFAINPLEAKNE